MNLKKIAYMNSTKFSKFSVVNGFKLYRQPMMMRASRLTKLRRSLHRAS